MPPKLIFKPLASSAALPPAPDLEAPNTQIIERTAVAVLDGAISGLLDTTRSHAHDIAQSTAAQRVENVTSLSFDDAVAFVFETAVSFRVSYLETTKAAEYLSRNPEYAKRSFAALERVFTSRARALVDGVLQAVCDVNAISGGSSSTEVADPAVASSAAVSLTVISRAWTLWDAAASLLRQLLSAIDVMYVARQYPVVRALSGHSTSALRAFLLALFARTIGDYQRLLNIAAEGFVARVREHRQGIAIPLSTMVAFRTLAVHIKGQSFYFEHLEPLLLSETRQFYQQEAGAMLSSDDSGRNDGTMEARFISHALRRVAEEVERAQMFCFSRSAARVEEAVDNSLVAPFLSTVMDGGIQAFLQSENHVAIRGALALAQRRFVNATDDFRKMFREAIAQLVAAIVKPKETDQIVPQLMVLKRKIDDIIVHVRFDSPDVYRLAMREAFDFAMKPKQNKIAELLAKHVDGFLRDGQQRTEAEIESALDDAMRFFMIVPAKDVFEAFYSRDFAKRLLWQRSASEEGDKFVISKLREACGPTTGAHLEGMLRDLEVSKEITSSFRHASSTTGETSSGAAEEAAAAAASSSIEVTWQVLTTTYWPTYPIVPLALPPLLQAPVEAFSRLYNVRFKGRRLVWCHVMSNAVVKGFFNTSKKDLVVTLVQAVVLNAFNHSATLSFADIRTAIGFGRDSLSKNNAQDSSAACAKKSSAEAEKSLAQTAQACHTELICALLSLTAGNAKVLKRTNAAGGPATGAGSSDVPETDKFTFAADFTHKLQRIRVSQVQLRDTAEDAAETYEKVFSERQYVVDACIVRFMKSRRRATHAELVAEVTVMLKFPVQPADLKKRVEVLIERDYMTRDETNPSEYVYVA